MSFLLQPFQVVLAVLSESIRKEQQKVIEYLQLENQILRGIFQIPETVTQPTRGPPTVAQPSISPREIRDAA